MRVLLVCLALVAGLSVLSGRLVYLQWTAQGYSKSLSPGKSLERPLLAQTGYIIDRHEEIIARNNPVTTIIVDKTNLGDASVVAAGVAYSSAVLREDWADADENRRDQIVRSLRQQVISKRKNEDIVRQHLSFLVSVLTPHLQYKSKEELSQKIGELGSGEVILAKDVPEEVADKIQNAVRENRIQGLRFEKKYRRIYPHPKLAPQVIGIVNHEGNGVAGIEKSMNHYLHGKDGYEKTKRDVRNLPLGKTSGVIKPPIKGLDIQLTLDLTIQAVVEEELDAGLAFAQSERGTIIVMQPDTGEILAMASRPTFNLNKRENFENGGSNYAVEAVYEPGSTFKIIATSGVIEEGLANSQTTVFCHNGSCPDFSPPLKDYSPFGYLTLEQVLAKSSNIGTYQFAKRLGKERFYHYMEAFGFGDRTGIELGGEQAGIAARSNNGREFASKCYGYAVSVTPLQIANAYCVIANGGKLMKPMLTKAALAPNGMRVANFHPEVIRQVISPQTAQMVRRALATVTEPGGTATRAAVDGFDVAGKTGTAWKVVNGEYDRFKKVVSFVGMLPAENPDFVCVVVIDEPKATTETLGGNVGGGTVAAPIFAKVASRVASCLNLKPTRPYDDVPLASQ